MFAPHVKKDEEHEISADFKFSTIFVFFVVKSLVQYLLEKELFFTIYRRNRRENEPVFQVLSP
jgi:hypothetical protein